MKEQTFQFATKTYPCYFDADLTKLNEIVNINDAIIITDENVSKTLPPNLDAFRKIIIPAGEQHKQQATVDKIIEELIKLNTERQSIIIGIGGGVITDIAGYVASVYMRGVKCGLIPTSILAMVDASVGGKNGVDVGIYKNLVGTIRHPEFLMFDNNMLSSLPQHEWVNGFAEVIKHGCIKDREMFDQLVHSNLNKYINEPTLISELIKRNVQIKYNIVSNDEFEKGDRKLLNFGHTIGHAIENKYELPHGHAISIGMVAACKISEQLLGFNQSQQVIDLLKKYGLPVYLDFAKEAVWDILLKDKKKEGNTMNFILLKQIGDAVIHPIKLKVLKQIFDKL